ncbi:MAG: cupin domain-containing protein [Clostridiales bacterium]|nr:cupin domain-containing protein [Clostridiales bacterium]
MDYQNLFEQFSNEGKLILSNTEISFADIPWSKHPTFEGVELKHIVTSKQTNGQFSYHLVRIAPNKKIGNHVHKTQLETHEVISGSGVCINAGAEIKYEPGVISILPMNMPHEVRAGDEGLYIFAKFMPALN